MFISKVIKIVIVGLINFFYITLVQSQSHSLFSSLPGIDSLSKTRQPVNINQYPWRIIGRVQTDLGQKCTGFFISPRVIVTASHCLWNKKTQRFIPVQSIHFLWGYQKGSYRQALTVKKIMINPEFKNHFHPVFSIDDANFDKAFLLVNQSSIAKEDLLPLGKIDLDKNTPLLLGGYEQDKKEIFVADVHCKLIQYFQIGLSIKLLHHDCEATYGSSGAPLLAINSNQQWHIIGMQVAAYFKKKGGIANILTLEEN